MLFSDLQHGAALANIRKAFRYSADEEGGGSIGFGSVRAFDCPSEDDASSGMTSWMTSSELSSVDDAATTDERRLCPIADRFPFNSRPFARVKVL